MEPLQNGAVTSISRPEKKDKNKQQKNIHWWPAAPDSLPGTWACLAVPGTASINPIGHNKLHIFLPPLVELYTGRDCLSPKCHPASFSHNFRGSSEICPVPSKISEYILSRDLLCLFSRAVSQAFHLFIAH